MGIINPYVCSIASNTCSEMPVIIIDLKKWPNLKKMKIQPLTVKGMPGLHLETGRALPPITFQMRTLLLSYNQTIYAHMQLTELP